MRAYWNGEEFVSRHGKTLKTPPLFRRGMPRERSLDGELWMGRQSFQQLTKLLSSTKLEADKMMEGWRAVKYMIFDLPNSQESVEKRMEVLKTIDIPDHAQIVDKIECRGQQHLEQCLKEIIMKGGEGMMAQRPCSKYQTGRTSDIVKVKVMSS